MKEETGDLKNNAGIRMVVLVVVNIEIEELAFREEADVALICRDRILEETLEVTTNGKNEMCS